MTVYWCNCVIEKYLLNDELFIIKKKDNVSEIYEKAMINKEYKLLAFFKRNVEKL